MEQIWFNLWLGDWEDAISRRRLADNGIDAVLNVAVDHCTSEVLAHANPELLNFPLRYRYPIIDGSGNRPKHFLGACTLLNTLMDEHDNTLVHCMAGMSRSPTIAAVVLAYRNGGKFEHHLNEIAKLRKIVNPDSNLLKLGEWALKPLKLIDMSYHGDR